VLLPALPALQERSTAQVVCPRLHIIPSHQSKESNGKDGNMMMRGLIKDLLSHVYDILERPLLMCMESLKAEILIITEAERLQTVPFS
jgi:hypothetical protein